MSDIFDKGDLVRCEMVFRNLAGGLVDPGAVFFELRRPDNTTVNYQYTVNAELVRASQGVFYVDVSALLAGTYKWRWHSTGSGQAADQGQFVIRQTNI